MSARQSLRSWKGNKKEKEDLLPIHGCPNSNVTTGCIDTKAKTAVAFISLSYFRDGIFLQFS